MTCARHCHGVVLWQAACGSLSNAHYACRTSVSRLSMRPSGTPWSSRSSSSTGYDVAEAVKQFLRRNGHTGRSICEVLQDEGSPHVGTATVFMSHVQASHVGSLLGTLREAPNLFDECTAKTIYWIDFFSLRQGEKDAFVPEQIVDVMKVRRRQRGASALCRPGGCAAGLARACGCRQSALASANAAPLPHQHWCVA